MKIEVDDKHCGIMVNAIDALIKVYDQYGYKLVDVPTIANVGIAFAKRAEEVIKEADKEDKFNKEHPEFTRGPNPDEKLVLGKGYVKK